MTITPEAAATLCEGERIDLASNLGPGERWRYLSGRAGTYYSQARRPRSSPSDPVIVIKEAEPVLVEVDADLLYRLCVDAGNTQGQEQHTTFEERMGTRALVIEALWMARS